MSSAVVTIQLDELDELRMDLVNANKRVFELEAIIDPNITIECNLEFGYLTGTSTQRLMLLGNWNTLTPDEKYSEVRSVLKESMEEIVKTNEFQASYNKIPRFIKQFFK